MNAPKSQPGLLLLLIVLMALSAFFPWYATRQGEGFDVDSIFYISQARTVVKTGTLEIPNGLGGLTTRNFWAPLYPLTLAVLSYSGVDALVAARWLNILLYPLSTLLVGLLAVRVSRSCWGGILAAFLFVMAPSIMQAHVMAMSDSLALAFGLLSLWLLLLYRDYGRYLFLAGAALAAGCSLLTRYDAVTQIPAAFLFLAFNGPGTTCRRRGAAVGFVLLAGLPLLLYQFSHWQSSTLVGTPDIAADHNLDQVMVNDRKFKFYGLTQQHALSALRAYEDWLAPVEGLSLAKRALIMLALCSGLAAALAQALRPGSNGAGWRPDGSVMLLLVNLLAHEALLYFTTLFLDPSFNPYSRYHIPSFVIVVVLVAAILAAWVRALPAPAHRLNSPPVLAASLLLALLFGTYAYGAFTWVRQADDLYLGLASSSWRDPETLALLRQLPATAPIYSNQVKAIYLYARRTDFYTMPSRIDSFKGTPTADFDQQMAGITAALTENNGTLVFFTDDLPSLHRSASLEQLQKYTSLRVDAQTAKATFFVANKPVQARVP